MSARVRGGRCPQEIDGDNVRVLGQWVPPAGDAAGGEEEGEEGQQGGEQGRKGKGRGGAAAAAAGAEQERAPDAASTM